MTTVEVLLDEAGRTRLVGQAYLTRQRSQISTTFLYDPDYLSGGGMRIDPALPLVSGSQHQTGLFGAFADSAPDRWGRNLIEKAERTRAREDDRARAGWTTSTSSWG
jgi:serine/threonine-protein kinase HipA